MKAFFILFLIKNGAECLLKPENHIFYNNHVKLYFVIKRPPVGQRKWGKNVENEEYIDVNKLPVFGRDIEDDWSWDREEEELRETNNDGSPKDD